MEFKSGYVVTVVIEHEFWMSMLDHDTDTYTVASVGINHLPCCAGHLQYLIMTDGSRASAAWFDPDLVGKPKVWCSGRNHYPNEEF